MKQTVFLFLVTCFVSSLVGCAPSPTSPNSSGWVRATAHAAFSNRYGLSGTVFNNLMWVIGGTDSTPNYDSDVWSSGDGANWTKANGNAPFGGRYGHQVLTFNGRIWLIAGNNNCALKNDVWSSSDGVSWALATAAAAFPAREDFGAVVFNGAMWVMGGWGGGSSLSDVWTSTDGITWAQVTANSGVPLRWGSVLTAYNGAMWILAGANGGIGGQICARTLPTSAFSDVWTSTNGSGWAQVSTGNLFNNIYYTQAVVNKNEIWMTAGFFASACCSQPENNILHSSDGITWGYVPNPPFDARFYHLSLAYKNQVWLIAGCTYQNQGLSTVPVYLNDVWHSP